MNCAKCGGKLSVIETSNIEAPGPECLVYVIRLRRCSSCNSVIESVEVVQGAMIDKNYKHSLRKKK